MKTKGIILKTLAFFQSIILPLSDATQDYLADITGEGESDDTETRAYIQQMVSDFGSLRQRQTKLKLTGTFFDGDHPNQTVYNENARIEWERKLTYKTPTRSQTGVKTVYSQVYDNREKFTKETVTFSRTCEIRSVYRVWSRETTEANALTTVQAGIAGIFSKSANHDSTGYWRKYNETTWEESREVRVRATVVLPKKSIVTVKVMAEHFQTVVNWTLGTYFNGSFVICLQGFLRTYMEVHRVEELKAVRPHLTTQAPHKMALLIQGSAQVDEASSTYIAIDKKRKKN